MPGSEASPGALADPAEIGAPRKGRVRVGVVGCGLVAQLMHLHYLAELGDRFEVTALCDLSPAALEFAGRGFPDAARHLRSDDLLAEPLDAVLVSTPGSHAPVAIAAAQLGVHVFVEKPMCFNLDEGARMIDAAARAGVVLMVGYMKRYDQAYEELQRSLARGSVVFARITTLESPFEPYVAHYPLRSAPDADPGLLAELASDDERRVSRALDTDDPVLRKAYRAVVLGSFVHELNAVRGLLGEPTELRFARIWGAPSGLQASFGFGEIECTFAWVALPGIARYEQEWAFYGPNQRATLILPSPYLRSAPSRLILEGGDPGTASSWHTERIVGYEEAFKRELVEFHECIVEGRQPRTSGEDALHDVAISGAIIRAHVEGRPVANPGALPHPRA